VFLFADGVAMEDGQRAKNGLEEFMTGLDTSSPSELYIDFFCNLLVLNTFLLATAGTRIS
jgi:hypothetical protein